MSIIVLWNVIKWLRMMTKQFVVSTLWVHKARKAVIKAFGGHCGSCGKKLSRSNAEFAHLHGRPTITGRGRGSYLRISNVMLNPASYWLACHGCHEDYDRENGDWRGQKNNDGWFYLKCPECGESRRSKRAKDCIEKEGMCPTCSIEKKYGWRGKHGGRYWVTRLRRFGVKTTNLALTWLTNGVNTSPKNGT